MKTLLAATCALLLLTGCASSLVSFPPRPTAAAIADVPSTADALLAADSVEPEIVALPPLPRWPILMRTAGPFYTHVMLAPLVIQTGILADARRADAGAGVSFAFGMVLFTGGTTMLGLEGVFGQSSHYNPTSEVDGTASRQCVAGRLLMGGDQARHPFVVAGVGSYALAFDGLDDRFDLSGIGVYAGGGVDFVTTRNLSVRVDGEVHIWDAAESGSGNGGVAGTVRIGVGAALSF